MLNQDGQPIAIICAHSNSTSRMSAADEGDYSVYVRSVGKALAALGWKVDIFTRKTNPDDKFIVQHSPYCRTIRLVAGPEDFIHHHELWNYLSKFVEAFQKFQLKESTNYPLIHTNQWISGWVGLRLQEASNIQLIHTYHSSASMESQSATHRSAIADIRVAIEQQILQQASCIVANSLQEQEYLRSQVAPPGYIKVIPHLEHSLHSQVSQTSSCLSMANQLSDLYRRLLAKSIMHELLWNAWMCRPLGTSTAPTVLNNGTSAKTLTKVS